MRRIDAPARADALLAEEAIAWRAFRAQLDAIARRGLERRTPAGWTYHDLIAHVAAWQESVPPRLAAMRAGAYDPSPYAADDEFNARVTAERRALTSEALLDELDRAHTALVEAVTGASELADQREVDLIAGNAFAHYEEHQKELAAGVER